MHATQIESVLDYCLTSNSCRSKDRSIFLASCEALTFETLAQALSASQLTGLFVNALDDLELISPRVAAIKVRLQPEIIIRDRFNESLLNELARLCNMKPHYVQPIVLGGPSLWSGIYRDTSERHSEDLDLFFCSEEDFDCVASVAIGLGYRNMKSESSNVDTEGSSAQRLSLHSFLYCVDRELVLNKQEASAYRQLRRNDLNTYGITEANPGQFVITHFLELHRLSPTDCASEFSTQRHRYIREAQFSEYLCELDTSAQIVFTAFKYREKIQKGSFFTRADSKRLKLFGDFIRLVETASNEQIAYAKLIAQQCGLSDQLSDLLSSVSRMNPSLPIEASENITARPDCNAITHAIGSCSQMLINTFLPLSEPVSKYQDNEVAGCHKIMLHQR